MTSLGSDHPLYGIQARGILECRQLPQTFEEMVADYIAHIRIVQPNGPYHLLGWSLGGNIIQAMAVELQSQGETVGVVAMLDAYPNPILPLDGAPGEEESLTALMALAGYDPESLGDKPLSLTNALEALQQDGSALASLDKETILNLRTVFVNSVRILDKYQPRKFNGDVLFFRSTIIPDWFSPLYPEAWEPYVNGTIEQHAIDCRHLDMCRPGALAKIGNILASYLHEKVGGS